MDNEGCKGIKLVLLSPPSPADDREAHLPAAGPHTQVPPGRGCASIIQHWALVIFAPQLSFPYEYHFNINACLHEQIRQMKLLSTIFLNVF